MLPTPDTSHVPYQRVYEPAEDSFLLLDTLSSPSETAFLRTRLSATPTPLVLEVGSGSGIVLAFLAAHAGHIFGRTDVLAAAVDANPHACHATAQTVARTVAAARQLDPAAVEVAGAASSPSASGSSPGSSVLYLGAVQGDLASALRPRSVDVLVCNPPYVPTETLPSLPPPQPEVAEATAGLSTSEPDPGPDPGSDAHLLSLSWAGGRDGMETTERLVASLPEVLTARGCAYVLLCARNRPDEVAAGVAQWGGGVEGRWRVETVGRSGGMGGWERLVVLRIWREGGRGGEGDDA